MQNKNKFLKGVLLGLAFIFLLNGLFYTYQVKAQDDGVRRLQNPIGGTKEKPKGETKEEEIKRIAKGETDVNVTLKKVVDIALQVLGSITLLVFVIGGLMWLTSGGNEQRVSMGTKTMLYAVIGIFVIFSSYAILNALIKILSG